VKVGLDIGTQMVKMVRLARGARGYRIVQLGLAEVSPKEDTLDARTKAQAEAIRSLLRDVQPKRDLIVTSLSDSGLLIRQATLPRMPQKDLARSIPFEARKYLPYDPAQVVLRYQVVSESRRDPTCQVLLVAVPQGAFQRHRALLEMAGVEPYAIEVGPLALANASLLFLRPSQENSVLLDLGASRTVINIMRDGETFFCRQLPASGEKLTEEIRGRLGVPAETAERLKRGRPNPGEPDSDQVFQALRPTLDSLVLEIRRSLAYYDNATGRAGFSRMLLAGGGALMPGLGKFLEENLGLAVGVMDVLKGVSWDEDQVAKGLMDRTGPLWVQALGLATRR
jgi:type IV pilus assembly protein PilM